MVVAGRGRLGTSLAGAAGALLLPGGELGAADLQAHDLVFLAVPDPAVHEVAARLAPGLPEGVALVHLAGALPLSALEPAARRGSFHPLQSFPVPMPPEHWHGVTVGVDASDAALMAELEGLARRLGARPRQVAGSGRAAYHAAAVIASNYLVGLAAEAVDILAAQGWPRAEALGALLPLMRGSVENLGAVGLPSALIGPVRRGDAETVARQLAALSESGPRSAELYRILGLSVLEVAREAGLDEAAAKRVEQALTAEGGSDRR